MLLRITRHCSAGCSHCMVNCKPDNNHMSAETLIQSLKFCDAIEFPSLIITGGEPLEHPDVMALVSRIKNHKEMGLVFCTNGKLLTPEIADELDIPIQVVNDPKYYPFSIPKFAHRRVTFFDTIPAPISGVGRASGLENKRKAPSCFNLRSLVKHSEMSLNLAMLTLAFKSKLCTPVIDPDGSILAGEFGCCKPFGTVWDTPERLEENLRNHTCDECGMSSLLTPKFRSVIW